MGNSLKFLLFYSFRIGRASKCAHKATRHDEADPAAVAPPPPQAEMAELHVPMSAPPPTTPRPTYRPRVHVYGNDLIPGHPTYPEAPSTELNGDAAAPPPNPFVNNAAAQGQAVPGVTADSTIDSQAPQSAHPWGNSIAVPGNLPASSASVPRVSQLAPPGAAAPPSDSAVTTAVSARTTARLSVSFVDDPANQPASSASVPSASQAAPPAGTMAASSASPLRPSARGSQMRLSQMQEALGEK